MNMINRSGTDQVMTQTFNRRKLSSYWSIYGIWHMIYSPLHVYDVFHCFYISKKQRLSKLAVPVSAESSGGLADRSGLLLSPTTLSRSCHEAGGSRVNVRNGRMFRFFFGPRQKNHRDFYVMKWDPFFGGWDQTIENIQIYGNFWGISLITMMVPLGWGPLYKQSSFLEGSSRGV